ncbi:MAG: hypothetical protein WBA88_14465 [Pseudaminobacter sp.]
MTDFRKRYSCVQADDGLWTVIDARTGRAASLAGKELSGKPQQRAEAARDVLNNIHESRAYSAQADDLRPHGVVHGRSKQGQER